MSDERIIDVIRRGGDANLGQALLRLAHLAQASHRYTVATTMAQTSLPLTAGRTIESGRSAAAESILNARCTEAAGDGAPRPLSSVCKEANR